jgi:hypothetical protein
MRGLCIKAPERKGFTYIASVFVGRLVWELVGLGFWVSGVRQGIAWRCRRGWDGT